jgi:tripartite-type tricarboxylate transporter receptor subunit TctC
MATRLFKAVLRSSLFLLGVTSWAAQAQQAWPTQRVTLVSPLPAGGAVDIVARNITPYLEQKWKQSVIIEYRPGAGMMLAAGTVARATPDGYTLLLSGNINPGRLFMKVDFAESDLKPVVQLVRGAYLVATNTEVPAKTLAEFIAYAKAHPGTINYGTIPNTYFDLDYIDFAQKAGIQMTGIPYQGTVLAATALSRNELQFFFGVPTTLAPLLNAGKLTILAATSQQRMQQHPNVPTIRELGIDFDTGYDFGFYAPGRTPDALVAQIGADAAAAVKQPAVVAKFLELGFESSGQQAAAWGADNDRHMRIYTDIAKRTGVKPQ